MKYHCSVECPHFLDRMQHCSQDRALVVFLRIPIAFPQCRAAPCVFVLSIPSIARYNPMHPYTIMG